jgi:hypothetical protein
MANPGQQNWKLVASTKTELEGVRDKTAKGQATPPTAIRRELPRITGWAVASSGAGQAKFLAGTEQPKLYSEALGGNSNRKATNSVTSKESNSPDTVKDIVRSRINPTDIREGSDTNR